MKEEYTLQKIVVKWLHSEGLLTLVSGADRIRGVKQFSILKALGYQNGTPDLFIIRPNKQYAGLFIEFKSSKGKLSDSQLQYIELLKELGYCVCVGSDYYEIIAFVKNYLKNS